MSLVMEHSARFVDRRVGEPVAAGHQRERRQFADGHASLSPEAQALANAVDQYKLMHRRRFITHEELLGVIKSLGYRR